MSVRTEPAGTVLTMRLGRPELAVIIVGLLGLFFLMLANLMDSFALGDSTPLVQIGWVIVTVALASFTGLMVMKIASPAPQRVE